MSATNVAVADGANSLYGVAPLKVMHLLKQPTKCDPPSIPDLVDRIAGTGKPDSQFMRRVGERSCALLNSCSCYDEVRRASEADLCRGLQSVAIVNLCHDKLARNTPKESLLGWAKNNKSRWHGQIVKCRPRIIVCGGTFDAVWKALGKPSCSHTSTGMRYFDDDEVERCTYIEMPHPGAHYPIEMVLTFLIAGAREILA